MSRCTLITRLSRCPLVLKGKYDEAEPLYVEDIAISEKALGPEHPDLADWLNNWALSLDSQARC